MRNEFTINTEGLQGAFGAIANGLRQLPDSPEGVVMARGACAAVAHLIACSGPYGGAEQTELMDMATREGFTCEFWGGYSVRVNWIPSESD